MLRACLLTLIIGLPSLASAAEIAPANVMPVARASSGVFDALKPLLDAREQESLGDFQNSFTNYGTVLLHDADNIEALFGLANSALKLGKGEMATKAYSRLSRLNLTAAQKTEQFTGQTLADVMTGALTDPEAGLKTALKTAPNDHRLWNALGQHYDSQKKWTQSWDAYQRAEKAGFSTAGLHNNLGMSFLAQKKYRGAISHFKYAVNLASKNTQYKNNYRFALLVNGDYRAALEGVSDNDAGMFLGDAGLIAMQREDYVLARILLKKAIEISPSYNAGASKTLDALKARQN